jgi:hypothetical protein
VRSNDIIVRLESAADGHCLIHPNDCREAAAEIKRLIAELDALNTGIALAIKALGPLSVQKISGDSEPAA